MESPRELWGNEGKVSLKMADFPAEKQKELYRWWVWLSTGKFAVEDEEIPSTIEGDLFFQRFGDGTHRPVAAKEAMRGRDLEARRFLAGVAPLPAKRALQFRPGPVTIQGKLYLKTTTPGKAAPYGYINESFESVEDAQSWYDATMSAKHIYPVDGSSRAVSGWKNLRIQIGNLTIVEADRFADAVEAARNCKRSVTSFQGGGYVPDDKTRLGYLKLVD